MSVGSNQSRIRVVLVVFVLGFSSVITQLVLMRELLCVYHGNELVLGIVLGNWLLGSGMGAWLGRGIRRNECEISRRPAAGGFLAGLMLIALLPVALVLALRFLRNVIFVRGAMVGVSGTFWSSLLFLLPYCALSGLLLTLACGLGSEGDKKDARIRQVYIADGLGSMVGGLLFTFLLVRYLGHFALLTLMGVFVGALVFVLALRNGFRILASACFCGLLALVGFGLWGNWEERSAHWQFPGQRMVLAEHSPYGRILVTESSGQLNVIENGVVVGSSRNVEHAEETAHYAMAQRPQARRVLLVSGTLSGVLSEVLKYPVEEVVAVELDARMIELARKFLGAPATDSRIRWVTLDARQFVRRTVDKFDVVILDLPDPSTTMINRYYTVEFYRELRRVLNPGGVLAFSLGHYENFVSRELAAMLSSGFQTVRQAFAQALLLPGLRVFFLASDQYQSLHADIAERLTRAGIDTRFVNANYLKGAFTTDRLADIQRAATQPAAINGDFNPTLYFHQVRNWVSLFAVRFGPWEIGLLLAILAASVGLSWQLPSLAVFVSGFTASAMEVTLLLAFQIISGALYEGLGLIVAVFMAGLVLGAWITRGGHKTPGPRMIDGLRVMPPHPARSSVTDTADSGFTEDSMAGSDEATQSARQRASVLGQLGWITLALAILCAILPLVLPGLSHPFRNWLGSGIAASGIPALVFLLAVLVGMQFPLASRISGGNATATASRLYTADFLGAFLGALIVSAMMLPLLGMAQTCWLTAGLNGIVGGFILWRKQR